MLTLVPTPIGNLGDLTFRTLEVLKEAELFFCEDTRVTKKLLNLISQRFEITFENKEFKSLHSHNENQVISNLDTNTLREKKVVYLSDAGMPCVSDPGGLLVDLCIKEDIEYEVLPGANALLTAYAMSGFNNTEFSFFGFLDHKGNSRKDKLNSAMNSPFIAILYESPHRLLKLLKEMVEVDENKEIFLVKELTKLYQKHYKGSTKEVYKRLKDEEIRGEWVVVIDKIPTSGENITLEDLKELQIPAKQKAKLISKLTGIGTKEIYNQIIEGTI